MYNTNTNPILSIDVSISPAATLNGQEVNVTINSKLPKFNLINNASSIYNAKQSLSSGLQTPRHSLKRRRTDDDLQRDRRSKDESVDFCLAGVNTRTHFRIRRSDPFWRSLDAFAERKGKKAGHLSLFYEGEWVSRISTPDDLGLFNGECLHVYEMIP
ncbi:hypothetical protein M409DRAFT_23174 [Zasmidium cellare ATCC 36951]|uniref:Rad60/SUMO-like domain-containing protein n=1 Tax=Zasmidium cellare ATCC 36951 TaxID=1080233 RepID=A0A6A6CM69_ZASCE|nr:uncharacterized protein M409DRAFT_23174 [Zasmidium cellare ATCC 36951]KAF2166536.1 hypothetical protein M409DRAFT_23174 [Zasmidium cellare ATCC 36951]